ncbi:MAG: cysteine hydrolase [Lentisphaeria bacterium]|nr:cysteine hydrolase [Lentisphaeria bacterium]
MYEADKTAIILIGYQNDYFAKDGILHAVVQDDVERNNTLENTLNLLNTLQDTNVCFISTPIHFSPDYHELNTPAGLMAQIKDLGAFSREGPGGATIPELISFGDRVNHITGKTSFNAFNGTGLHDYLKEKGIDTLLFAGVVTSICIDSTARAASEYGYNCVVLRDCISGRSMEENNYYCENIFPLYARVEESGAIKHAF